MTRRGFIVPAVAVSALLLAGCAPAPEENARPSSTAAPEYCARMVTNSGGLEDRSFNQSSWEGLQQAATDFDIEVDAIVSTSETDLAPNVEQAVGTGCDFILTVGYELADATTAAALANPEVHFSIVDEQVAGENIKPVVFDTAQAAFLAGYLAAGVSRTGIVATFGGGNQPPVTLFMDGFVDGVAKYNELRGTAVRVLGWDKATQDGVFTGDFEDTLKGKTTAERLLDRGADVIMPVAGQVGEGAAAAILEHGESSLIWVDNDGYDSLPAQFRPILLTSVLKNTQDAVLEIIAADLKGDFSNKPYVGTLENSGVDIAPFHDRAGLVSSELAAGVDELRAAIVAGILEVTGPNTPR